MSILLQKMVLYCQLLFNPKSQWPRTQGRCKSFRAFKSHDKEKLIKEEKRLARVLALINYEAQIVPRGAYYRGSSGKLDVNPDFKGACDFLTQSQSTGLPKDHLSSLKHYLHFREGYEIDSKTLTENINTFDETIDIFEPIEADVPKGKVNANLLFLRMLVCTIGTRWIYCHLA